MLHMWCSREVRECSFTECWSTQMLMLLLSAFAVSWRKKTNGIDVWKCTQDGTTKRCEVRENCPQLQRIIYFNNLQYCYYITIKVTHVCTSPIRTWYLICHLYLYCDCDDDDDDDEDGGREDDPADESCCYFCLLLLISQSSWRALNIVWNYRE